MPTPALSRAFNPLNNFAPVHSVPNSAKPLAVAALYISPSVASGLSFNAVSNSLPAVETPRAALPNNGKAYVIASEGAAPIA